MPRIHKVEDFAQAIRAIGEPIHARTADQISMAKLLTLLFEITGLFDMKTRTELVLLQKTMVVVEGVGAHPRPQAEHVVDVGACGAGLDRGKPWTRRQIAGRRPRRRDARAFSPPICRWRSCARKISSTRSKTWRRTALNYPKARSAEWGEAAARGARLGHIALWIIAGACLFLLLR